MRKLRQPWLSGVEGLSVAWVLFFVYTSLQGEFHTFVQVPLCLMVAFVLVFTLFPASRTSESTAPTLLDGLLILAGAVICIYVMARASDFIAYPTRWTVPDLAASIALFALLIEGSRRSLGWTVPLLALFMFFYTVVLGNFLPGRWWFGDVDVARVFANRFFRSDLGYWGTLPKLAVVTIPLFLVFGPILFSSGAGQVFMNLAAMIGNRVRGGSAQVAVVASALFGTISGAAVANTATIGVLTIPTMKKSGFSTDEAGAIEAAASTGGQIMPPIMGATAFLMADFLDVPYAKIALAATLPAILFFFAIAATVYLLARRRNLVKPPRDSIPTWGQILVPSSLAHVLIPLGILATMMVRGFTAEYAVGWATVAAIVVSLAWSDVPFRQRVRNLVNGAQVGAKAVAWLLITLVLLQTVVSLLSYSGLGLNFAATIFELGSKSSFLALLLTAIIVLILGLGLNTTASYVIAYAVVAGPVVKLGFDPFGVSFFIFYYAVLSTITPPTCNTVFAAAAISGGSWWSTAWIACGIALGAFLLPFSWAYDPGLFMMGDPLNILRALACGILSIICLSVTTVGFLVHRATVLERLLFLAAAIFLLFPTFAMNAIGLALAAIGLVAQLLLTRTRTERVIENGKL
jgi:TRAP transporter 4TM/12TM fusion protein